MSKFKKFQLILAIFLIGVSSAYGGYYLGVSGYEFQVRKDPPKINVTNKYPSDTNVDFALFWEVWEAVNSSYLERPLDAQELVYGAISGMVSAIDDPYTSFLPPVLNETVTNSLNGVYHGIGAELAIKEDRLVVVAPLDGSPAQDAGVRAGDAILEIEGESAFGLSLTEAVSKIRGEVGTISTLTLQRGDGDPFIVRIKRGAITVKSVTWEDKGQGTAYIRVGRFGGDTNKDWATAVSELNSQMSELDAVIVDLRGNPGGYLQSAVYLAEEFITDEAVLIQESSTGQQIPFKAERVGAFENVAGVFVLIDGGSASASEILAGALDQNVNAVLVGTQSFGKGTIQDAREFDDGSGVHITVAKWLLPDGSWIHGVGISPDVTVEISQEDILNEQDPQLERAIELANEL